MQLLCVISSTLKVLVWDAQDDAAGSQWLVEVLSEPKLQWHGMLSLHWEEPRGSTGQQVGADPIVVDHSVKDTEETTEGSRAARSNLDSSQNNKMILRQVFPVTWTMPASTAGKPVTLQGRLKGAVLHPPAAVITVAEILKSDGKRFEGKDGSKLTMKKTECKADGSVEMIVELTRAPQPPSKKKNGAGPVVVPLVLAGFRQAGPGGRALGLYAFDTKGRQYFIAATELSKGKNNVSYQLLLVNPPAKDSVPGKLEYHAPFPVEIERTFTLPNVRPQ